MLRTQLASLIGTPPGRLGSNQQGRFRTLRLSICRTFSPSHSGYGDNMSSSESDESLEKTITFAKVESQRRRGKAYMRSIVTTASTVNSKLSSDHPAIEARSGKIQEGAASVNKDLNSQDTLPASNQDKIPQSVAPKREPNVGKPSLKENWSIEEEEYAGSSQSVSSSWHPGMPVISEIELAQISQIQPLILNFGEKSAIKNCFEMLQRKVQTGEIFQEFMDLEYEDPSDEFSCGNESSNRDKNRYRDILPYDSTRVPLGKSKDYINASYIKIVNSGKEYFYIATQGPLPGTISDFWQMVLESQADVIAMMSREVEDGIVKCHRYWPTSLKKPLDLKYFRIFLENYQIFQDFIIRMLKVLEKTTGTVHFVRQLQFTNWPDHGTPASTDNFIKFVRLARKSHQRGPIVVHCSAGIGRTGVMLCMDVVFCAIENNFLFNIKNIVTQMREHRCGMIQTKEQYHFCYKIVLEVLQKILTLD